MRSLILTLPFWENIQTSVHVQENNPFNFELAPVEINGVYNTLNKIQVPTNQLVPMA